MIITTKTGKSFDSEKDLTGPERHILQKLFLWQTMASSLDQFRREKEKALLRGWNDSGPIEQREILKTIIEDLEEKLLLRLNEAAEVESRQL